MEIEAKLGMEDEIERRMERLGYRLCVDCGEVHNVADLVHGLCPWCQKRRVKHLADLQRQYEDALRAGDTTASEKVAQIIRDYQRSEGVRLKDVPPPFRVK